MKEQHRLILSEEESALVEVTHSFLKEDDQGMPN
jgi:hypothetical protein